MLKKITTLKLQEMKQRGEKIAALTAYDFTTAKILDESGIDFILVGDSAANVFAGYEYTLQISMDEMLYHTKAVKNGVKQSFAVGDMPFLSYQCSIDEAVKNAGRFLQAGASAVKVEGGEPVVPVIKRIVESGIPVMGHLGLTPQSVHKLGGYKLQGGTPESEKKLMEDALMLQDAGIFCIVLEKMVSETAKKITEELHIPTIGIGAGEYCDGQILVSSDILGLNKEFHPKFVHQYAQLYDTMIGAFKNYIEDVKEKTFPSKEESY